MQINRLFEIVYLLLDKKTVTAGELARHFEVSARTIYRDVEALSSAGIPVYMTKGKGGGISLMDHFVLNKSVLSDKEQSDILSALQGLNALNVPDVQPVLQKLAGVFNKNSTSWIDVDFSHWGSDPDERAKFDLLKTAILSAKVITFDYFSYYGEKTRRVVEPLQMSFKEKAWYLKGYCTEKADYRTFKISRMRNIVLTEHDLTPHRQPPRETAYPPYPLTAIKLKLFSAVSHRIQDEFDPRDVVQNDDGSFTVTVRSPEDEWMFGYIMSFGPWCEVLEPEYIRKLIKKRFADALENYS